MSLPAWAFQPGVQVHVTDMLPIVPSDAENARRIVRHGFAAARAETGLAIFFPDSLGDVGPAPGAETHAILHRDPAPYGGGRYADPSVMVSRSLYRRLVDSPDDLLKHVSREDLYR